MRFLARQIVVLERRKNDFIAGTVPVFGIYERFVSVTSDQAKAAARGHTLY